MNNPKKILSTALFASLSTLLTAAPFDRVLDEGSGANVNLNQGEFREFTEFDGKLYAVGNNLVTTNDGSGNVNRNSLVYVSSDGGNTWEPSFTTGDLTTNFYAAATSSNRIVAVGGTDLGRSLSIPGFTVALTPGGIWTGTEVPTGGDTGDFAAISVAYGAGKFIYGTANQGRLYSSTDGLNWERLSWELDGSIAADVIDVIWDGKRFVVYASGQIFTSPDGDTWTKENANLPSFAPQDLTYLNGMYFVSGAKFGGADGYIASSPDLVTWTKTSSDLNQPITEIAYGGGYYVASTGKFGGTSLLYYSNDGENWTEFDAGLGDKYVSSAAYLENDWFISARANNSAFDPGIYKATSEFPPQGNSPDPDPDPDPQPTTNPWANAFSAGDGVFFDSNLGFFATQPDSLWTFNYLLGWIYPVGDYSPDLWIYVVDQNNWMYANSEFSGFTFRLSDGKWYFYDTPTNFFYPSS